MSALVFFNFSVIVDFVGAMTDLRAQSYAHGPGVSTSGHLSAGAYDKHQGDGNECKAGVGVSASAGGFGASYGIFSCKAEGPSFSASAEANHVPFTPVAEASAKVELSACKAGVYAGPLGAEFNPNIKTGLAVGTTE